MEFCREFDSWKAETVRHALEDMPKMAPQPKKVARLASQRAFSNLIDRLWFDTAMEIISKGNVFNKGGKAAVPRLHTIDSPFEQKLGQLNGLESFRLSIRQFILRIHSKNGVSSVFDERKNESFLLPTESFVVDLATGSRKILGDLKPNDMFQSIDCFEILLKGRGWVLARSSKGHVVKLPPSIFVSRVSDCARAPDGYSESQVALATFPVAHFVSHRTLRINSFVNEEKDEGFVTAFVGDAQASVSDFLHTLWSNPITTLVL
jgi:hypothetical protein